MKHLRYAKKCKRINDRAGGVLYTLGVSIYLDAVGFAYKQDPYDQAMTPGARSWRKKSEGLDRGCTRKGSKEGTLQDRFIVAISYSKGVVLCKVNENK